MIARPAAQGRLRSPRRRALGMSFSGYVRDLIVRQIFDARAYAIAENSPNSEQPASAWSDVAVRDLKEGCAGSLTSNRSHRRLPSCQCYSARSHR